MISNTLRRPISRRNLLGLTAGMAGLPVGTRLIHAQEATPDIQRMDELIIDLDGEPVTLDPAMAYAPLDWSVVHAIFDAVVGFDRDGKIRPVAAESFEVVDETTFEVVLREGVTFHDGSPVTSDAVIRGMDHVKGGDSLVKELFGTVEDVQRVDDLTARIVCSEPSPWLPAQMAAWHVLLPEGATPDSLADAPVGSGPYSFSKWDRGNEIVLQRFEDYRPAAVKGAPIANSVRYHFVPDATTRVSNLLSGSTHLVDSVPFDMLTTLEQTEAEVVPQELVGSAWIRIATDTEHFDDVRVRQALNMALDISALPGALIYEQSYRLASIHPGTASMGFDPALAPYAYDPDAAKGLLSEAGVEDGLEATLEITGNTPQSVAEALVAQWDEVGISVKIEASDYASFNANWADSSAPVLKMATWSPLYDPHTVLSLVWASDGALSRYKNGDVDRLIREAAVETNPDAREKLYQELAGVMFEDAAGVWLWNQVAVYGLSSDVPAWSSRPDEWVLPLVRE